MENNQVCYKCGKIHDTKDIKKFRIYQRSAYSLFPWMDIEIPICTECQKDVKEEWFNDTIEDRDIFNNDHIYEHEEGLFKYISTFDLEFQEKIFNQGQVFESAKIKKEDWIEQQKQILKLLK